jgi:molecular chaperone DnaK (HSP70)
MVKEAEENAEADKIVRQNVEAKNQLEAYLYNLRSSMQDSLKDKLSEEDKEQLSKVVSETLAWLDEHPNGIKSDYDEKKAAVEEVANPIITKAYKANIPAENKGTDDSDDNSSGPTVEEAD